MSVTFFPKVKPLRELPLNTGSYTLTEKMDGSNAGIARTENGLVVHSRTQVIADYNGTWNISNPFNGLVDYIKKHQHKFLDLPVGSHVFGEWLVPHTLSYPEAMYKNLYLFDRTIEGIGAVGHVGVLHTNVEYQKYIDNTAELIVKYEQKVGRPIKGVVFTPLTFDLSNPYITRYKFVKDSFKEDSKSKFRATKENGEKSIASAYPINSFLKVIHKVRDHNEGMVGKQNTGEILGRAWEDYWDEGLIHVLRNHKKFTVDFKKVHYEFNERYRAAFFAWLDTDMFPVWAQ